MSKVWASCRASAWKKDSPLSPLMALARKERI
jgi:hypothetical protein